MEVLGQTAGLKAAQLDVVRRIYRRSFELLLAQLQQKFWPEE